MCIISAPSLSRVDMDQGQREKGFRCASCVWVVASGAVDAHCVFYSL